MKHVPETWLKKLLWAYAAFGVTNVSLFLLAKFYEPLSFLQKWVGSSFVPIAVAAAMVIYIVVGVPIIRKQNAWISYISAHLAFLLVLYFSVETTGGYASHYFTVICAAVFLGGMIGLYAALLPIVLEFIGAILVILGSYSNPAGPVRMVIALVVSNAAAIAGWLFFRRWYEDLDQKEAAVSTGLAKMLSKERVQSEIILNAIDDGVVLISPEGVIRMFNPAAAKLSGWPEAEAIGIDYKAVLKLVDDKDVAYTEINDPFAKVFTVNQTVRDNKAILASRNDKRTPIDISVTPLHDADGNLSGAVGIFRNVEKERNEEQQRAEFISTASHEMRTPVAAIEGYLALALNEHVSRIDSKAREYLEKAHSSTQHLGKLFQDLLTSAKAEDGRLVNHPTVVEMGEYLDQLTDSLRFSAQKKGLLMDFTIGTATKPSTEVAVGGNKMIRPLYYVFVDPDRLREVITNLFDNAVKYTDAGKISIGLTGNDDVVQLYIKDTGPGIPREDVPHLFQKFYRVDNSSTRTIGGTGLGLFICRKIIEMYNGRIWVESEVRVGSTFYINLPRISNQKAEELKMKEAQQSQLVTPNIQ